MHNLSLGKKTKLGLLAVVPGFLTMRRHLEKVTLLNGRKSSTEKEFDGEIPVKVPDCPQQLYGIAEINFRRLLRKCEDMSDTGDYEGWRFEKYVEALEQLLNVFKASLENTKRDELLVDRLSSYDKRVATLKSIAHPDVNLVESSYRSLLLGDQDIPREAPVQVFASTSAETISKPSEPPAEYAVPLQNTAERQPLISTPPSLDAQRNALFDQSSPRLTKDLDMAVAAELDRQGQITDEMLYLAQSLKENMKTAHKLITNDFKVIDKATAVADRNAHRLEKETEKLAEQNQKNTSWWVLLALISLFGIFVMMVLFMRLFPKPRVYRNH